MTTRLPLEGPLRIALATDAQLWDLPQPQREGLVLRVLRARFATFLEHAATTLRACTSEPERKAALGTLVDYRTRVLAQRLKIDEHKVTAFRYAILSVLRDEAYARCAPSPDLVSPHVVKGREDEPQRLVLDALKEIERLTSTYTPVYRDSRVQEASESVYANDSKELVSADLEEDVTRLLSLARIALPSGETVAQRLQAYQGALQHLLTHDLWTDVLQGPKPHLDRLVTARSLQHALTSAQEERVVAHRYVIAGDEVTVPRIAPFALPGEEREASTRTIAYAVTQGWETIASGLTQATSFEDARVRVLELVRDWMTVDTSISDGPDDGHPDVQVFVA